MRNFRRDQFHERLSRGAPQGFRDDIDAAFGLVVGLGERVAKIRENRNLTQQGREQAVVDVLRGGVMDHFRQLQGNVKRARDHLTSQRAALVPKGPDKADLFREHQRAEMRSWLGKMPIPERIKVALESTNPLVREAIEFAPDPAMIGLPAAVHADFLRKNLEAAHGPKLRELEIQDEDVANTDSAIQVAAMDLWRVAGMDERRFNELAAAPKDGRAAA
jgi:hypothetical protein